MFTIISERTARMSAVARDLYFVSSGILAELAAVLFIGCYGALACWMRTLGLLFGLLNSHRFTLLSSFTEHIDFHSAARLGPADEADDCAQAGPRQVERNRKADGHDKNTPKNFFHDCPPTGRPPG